MVLTPPTALWAVPVSNIAGVARHVLDVAANGIPGWRLAFLTPPGDLPARLRELGAVVHEAPFGPDHGLASSVKSVREVVRRERPAVVHTHLAYADIVASLAVGRGPALVTTEHGIARDDVVYHRSGAKTRVMAAAHTARLLRFDAAVAVSRATADAMVEKWHPRKPITVIHNGVDVVPGASPTTGLRILSLARLSPEKRLPALVDGFAELRHTHPEARLTLAGAGEEEAALRAQVARLGLGDVVELPGFVDPEPAMASHDVLAMMSVWENCSYALLDAAARGMGVVASDVGGNPEILPSRALVAAEDRSAVAAALSTQGLDLAARPGLAGWPSVADMCEQVAGTYAALGGRS
ncbi:glycosyltransferase [Nocardioides oleivorans]|uniref:Glycosyltransferase n=1 Tax=Nocardioides oleivorans TaxID=273676 RepID=A0A4V1RL58_9ACTN|nr:glycosyltransferase family 4 protein [Nocardioides oleivorans]RYB94632.1 glycosyltransferase [Nocardioides oleivorans]